MRKFLRSYTLVELMIVGAMVGILASLVVGGYVAYLFIAGGGFCSC